MDTLTLKLNVVTPEVCSLLAKLMKYAPLQSFHLAGGTALALLIGHRRSIDLDLFTLTAFNAQELGRNLQKDFSIKDADISTNTILGNITDIGIDCIAHQYPLLEKPIEINSIRIYSIPDLSAMKLNAISNRGSKKDFWDIAALLNFFSINDLLSFYEKKYGHENLWAVKKSLSYFDDAEEEPDPIDLNGLSWPDIKGKVASTLT